MGAGKIVTLVNHQGSKRATVVLRSGDLQLPKLQFEVGIRTQIHSAGLLVLLLGIAWSLA